MRVENFIKLTSNKTLGPRASTNDVHRGYRKNPPRRTRQDSNPQPCAQETENMSTMPPQSSMVNCVLMLHLTFRLGKKTRNESICISKA